MSKITEFEKRAISYLEECFELFSDLSEQLNKIQVDIEIMKQKMKQNDLQKAHH